MTVHITDEELLHELTVRIEQNAKALSDLKVVNRKLLELNHKLQESETLKSNFISNIRNEINNPLNAIMGLAGQVTLLASGTESARLAGIIALEAQVLDFQLRNIFMAAELEAGAAEPVVSRVDVDALLHDLITSYEPLAQQKNVIITYSSPGLTDFCTDAEKLQTIISNLLANAIEFSYQGGTVELAASTHNQMLQITVQDRGIGINPADFQRIFDRFVQLDTGTQRQHHGHGLGLCVVKSLLDLLGGDIQLQSNPDAGSVFSVTLPEMQRDDDRLSFAEGGNLFLFDGSDDDTP